MTRKRGPGLCKASRVGNSGLAARGADLEAASVREEEKTSLRWEGPTFSLLSILGLGDLRQSIRTSVLNLDSQVGLLGRFGLSTPSFQGLSHLSQGTGQMAKGCYDPY